jgi:hypothetical protein
MSEREPGAGAPEETEETLLREVLRTQEEHREGGVDPELDEPEQDPGSEVQPNTP